LIFSAKLETAKPDLFGWALATLGNSDSLGDKDSCPLDELSSLQGKALMICGSKRNEKKKERRKS